MEQGRQAAPGDPRVWDRASVSVIPEPRLCWAYSVDTSILLFEEQVWAPVPPLGGPRHRHFGPQGARRAPSVQDAPSGCSVGAGSRLDPMPRLPRSVFTACEAHLDSTLHTD